MNSDAGSRSTGWMDNRWGLNVGGVGLYSHPYYFVCYVYILESHPTKKKTIGMENGALHIIVIIYKRCAPYSLGRFPLSLFFFVGLRIEMKVVSVLLFTILPDDLVAVSRAHLHIDVEESKRFQLQI
jgi:hypothetical protein